MKLISWNVNGIRAALKKGFADFVRAANPDVLCVQESRALPDQVELDFPQYRAYWNPAQRKGYSGTLVLSKPEPINVTTGIGVPEHDTEGRVITVEYPDYYLVNVYTPNSGHGLARLDYRAREWDPAFLQHVKNLEQKKPVIFCGDLNVAHQEIDLARPANNHHNAGFTDEERHGFDNLLAAGFLDTFREFEPGPGHYTWWSYRAVARARNIGWRIDYFCVSPALRPRLKNAFILPGTTGSDHCPVGVEMA